MEVTNNGQGGPLQIINGNTTDKVYSQNNSTNVQANSNDSAANGDGKLKEKDVKKAVEKLNKILEDKSTYLEYSVDKRFNQVVITVKDKNTNETIQELPPKKILDMVAKMCEMAGLLIDKKV